LHDGDFAYMNQTSGSPPCRFQQFSPLTFIIIVHQSSCCLAGTNSGTHLTWSQKTHNHFFKPDINIAQTGLSASARKVFDLMPGFLPLFAPLDFTSTETACFSERIQVRRGS
jgi:hypothetical protein